jgi:superfamily II DNA or RNA helicase
LKVGWVIAWTLATYPNRLVDGQNRIFQSLFHFVEVIRDYPVNMPSRHPATGRWTREGIFDIDDVDSWLDIEERITQIELPIDRGNAMEIFVEALINTHPIFQTTEVYPNCEGTMPEHVSELLNLSGDYGVDGVYHGTDQIFDAYQSKFRAPTGQPTTLNWSTPDDLSHLFADGERCRSKLVISNADDVVLRVRRQDGVCLFLRDDFLALTQDDIVATLSFIHDRPIQRSRFEPRPHQEDALNALHPIIWGDSRGQLIMPPGAGKTLVGLWACEQYFEDLRDRGGSETQVAVVFEPSLALVKQVLEQWLRHSSSTPNYQIICSDRTVESDIGAADSDIWDIAPEDFSSGVVQEASDVADFIRRAEGFTLLMSTYQSVEVIEEALTILDMEGFQFDFGVFDEAHHTAGVGSDRLFQRALSDDRVPIRKRLFMTATPRVITRGRGREDVEGRTDVSMDNEEYFGPIQHELLFSDATNPDRPGGQIIANYRIIIAEARTEEVDQARIAVAEVNLEGEPTPAEFALSQFALIRAMNGEATGGEPIRKAFTFHNRVHRARIFSTDESLGIGQRDAGIEGFHVNGTMGARQRTNIMQQFGNTESAILSNANCLVEGVDLPAVDMVAFIDPRASTTHIVQAVGRALRIPPGSQKTTGYVLIPVLRNEGEVETAIADSSYEKIKQVLDALSQYDSTLDEVLREERRARGRRGGLIGGRVRDRVIMVGFEDIDENVLYNDIAVHLVESLVPNIWETWGRLERVLAENPELDGWISSGYANYRDVVRDVAAFRKRYRYGTVPEEILEAAQAAGYRFTSPTRQVVRTDHGQERRPRLTIDERFLLVQVAIEAHGSVDIPRAMMLEGEDVFPNEERYCRRDGTIWNWPVGLIVNNLRIATRDQGTNRLSEDDIARFQALTDREGNHLRLFVESD